MTAIVRSNGLYFGAPTLTTAAALAITAASYTARVLADGGRIVDSAHLTSTFNFIAAQGMSPANLIFGPRFGVREANGRIDKLYAFNGNDLTRANAGSPSFDMWRLDTSGSFPLMVNNSQQPGGTGDRMQTQGLQYLVNPGDTSFVAAGSGVNMVANDGNILYLLSAYVPGSIEPRAFSIDVYNNDSAVTAVRFFTPDGVYNPASNGQVRRWEAGGGTYTDYQGVSGFFDFTNRQGTTWNNGTNTFGPANIASDGFAWSAGTFDPTATAMRFTCSGTVNNGSNTVYDHCKFAEVWHVSGGTSAFGLALSQRLHSLYF